jgi:hypothetical protein
MPTKLPSAAEALERIRNRAAVDITTSAVVMGISRMHASRSIKAGTFPVPIIRMGNRVIIPTAPLRELLGIEAGPEVA